MLLYTVTIRPFVPPLGAAHAPVCVWYSPTNATPELSERPLEVRRILSVVSMKELFDPPTSKPMYSPVQAPTYPPTMSAALRATLSPVVVKLAYSERTERLPCAPSGEMMRRASPAL